MKKNTPLILAFLAAVLTESCRKENEASPAEEVYTVFQTPVTGLSGLCFTADKSGFYAVSDKTGIYELNTDGTLRRKLNYGGSNDFEAISLHPVSRSLYLADESQMNVIKLSPDETGFIPVVQISIPGGIANKGLEGLSCGTDTLYITNQESPALLIKYVLSTGNEASRTRLDFASYLSDIFFDSSDQTIWICDSQEQALYHCTLSGALIASQDIPFIQKAEALVIDRAAGFAWIGCDASGKLYKIKLSI